MDKDKALEKIKKCLALSQSANEHEAAQAIKQAQALMRKYGLNDVDVALSEVSEASVDCALGLPSWHQLLINQCAKAFGVECYKSSGGGLAEVRFYGVGGKPDLAAYAYEVLLRQVKKARREYMKNQLSQVRTGKNKTFRADKFCEAWVFAVAQKITDFAMPPQEKGVLERYRKNLGEIGKAKTRDVKGYASRAQLSADILAGMESGKHAQLHHAMGGGEELKRLGA